MNTRILTLTSIVSLALIGCGGGSSSDEQQPNDGTTVDGTTVNVVTLANDTGELKNNAIDAIGRGFSGSLNAFGSTANQNSSFGNTINDVATGGSDQMGEDIPTDLDVQADVQNWMSISLGADANANSTTTREGNIVTVDPDEEQLCREEVAVDQPLTSQPSDEDLANCIAFFRDVTVNLVAETDEAGVLTYLYRQQPVISLGYSPTTGSIELDLGGLGAAIDGLVEIDPDNAPLNIPTMSGSYRISASQTNQTVGQEAGSLSAEVVKPVRLSATDEEGETSLSMEPGTLFSISADAATGQGSLSFDLGAIAAAAPTESGLGQMNLAGFTGEADVNPTEGVLVVRNFGLSKGPLSISINNEEVMTAALGAFGFRVTEGTDMEPGELILDGNMDLSVMVRQFADANMGDDIVAMALEVMAPGGTSFSVAGNGATQIGGAGPFTVTLSQTPASGDQSVESVQVNSGECFTDLFEEGSTPSTELCL